MDTKQRAELVRAIRIENKERRRGERYVPNGTPGQRARDPDASDMYVRGMGRNTTFRHEPVASTSRSRMEMARTQSRFHRVRRGENGQAYIHRTAEGGDASFAAAATRYDLRRARGAPNAPTWPDDGYAYGYDGSAARARARANASRRRPRR